MATVLGSVVPGMLERGSMNMLEWQKEKSRRIGLAQDKAGFYHAKAIETGKPEYEDVADYYRHMSGNVSYKTPEGNYIYGANFMSGNAANLRDMTTNGNVATDVTTQQQGNPFRTAAKINAITHALEQRRFAKSKPPMWGFGVGPHL